MSVPLYCRWTGEAFEPATSLWAKRADQEYVVGEVYQIAPIEERSAQTHSHQFAWLTEAWRNLPEKLADLYPTPEHLRKRALIEAGFYNEGIIDAGANAAALRVAAYLRGQDDFALVIVRGPLVVVRTAKSQSRRAMNKQEFQVSKSAIMDVIADLIGVAPGKLGSAA